MYNLSITSQKDCILTNKKKIQINVNSPMVAILAIAI